MDHTNLANQPGLPPSELPDEQVESEHPPGPSPFGFVQCRLPWLIGGGALLLYLVTIPHWITFLSLGPWVRAAGWDWHPDLIAPLQYIVTYLCRWLPSAWRLGTLSLMAAVCSTLALVLLARSVALLPHDRTRDQRQVLRGDSPLLSIRLAWLPPLLAVLVCGLQLTFWENAVVWTGEALDLLLFAYVIRCLLEFRNDRRDSWLFRLAFVYGLAMTNNFAMIGFLPAAAIALVWIKGLSVFKFRFFSRLALWGLAGLSLYLLLPTVQSFADLGANFWQLLRLNLAHQKNSVIHVRRSVVLMLSFSSVLPVLFMGIKWPASFGDISAAGNALTNLMTHVIHGVFLLVCLYVAFDPGFSPRKLAEPFAFLPFYYLGALSIGYCCGFFLLVFGTAPVRAWQRPTPWRKALNWGIVGLIWAAAIAAPAGLVYHNLPQLKATLGPALSQYAHIAAQSLPAQELVLLSDEIVPLYAVFADLERNGTRQNKILVETAALTIPYYQRYLAKHYPQRWPRTAQPLVRTMEQLEPTIPFFYLQPSFGYYFERFYLKPHKLVFEVKPSPTNSLLNPGLSAEERRENIQFWQQMKNEDLKPLLQALKPAKGKRPGASPRIGSYYSRAVDFFGVELEKAGDLEGAGDCFSLALDLKPDSPAALINQQYNKSLRAGHPEELKRDEEIKKLLSFYGGNWDILLAWNGPVDEPGLRNELGMILAKGRNYRQAALELLRVAALTPTNIDARVGLAEMCLNAGLFDLALNYVADVRTTEKKLHTADLEALLRTEAWAYSYRNELPTAEKLLTEAQAKYPLNDSAYATLSEIYLRRGHMSNAMEVLEKELKAQPENSSALNNYARLKILNNELETAIKLLDHALSLDPKNSLMLFNRAISNLRSGKLDDAQRDYQTLENTAPQVPYSVYYGLFEIAYQKKNSKTALAYGELYLKNAPARTAESRDVLARIKKIKSGSY